MSSNPSRLASRKAKRIAARGQHAQNQRAYVDAKVALDQRRALGLADTTPESAALLGIMARSIAAERERNGLPPLPPTPEVKPEITQFTSYEAALAAAEPGDTISGDGQFFILTKAKP